MNKQVDMNSGIEICRDVCRRIKLKPEDCMRKNKDGTFTFAITYPVPNRSDRFPIFFSVLPGRNPKEPNKLIVWSDITPIENIGSDKREEFFRQLLEANIQKIDTCTIGIARNNFITVKVERILHGLDSDELFDMLSMTKIVAGTLHSKICPRFGIPTKTEDSKGREISYDQQNPSDKTKPTGGDMLAKIQNDAIASVEKGERMYSSGEYLECYELYYKTAYDILNNLIPVQGVSPTLDTAKNSIEGAIKEVNSFSEDKKKCLKFKSTFDTILTLKS